MRHVQRLVQHDVAWISYANGDVCRFGRAISAGSAGGQTSFSTTRSSHLPNIIKTAYGGEQSCRFGAGQAAKTICTRLKWSTRFGTAVFETQDHLMRYSDEQKRPPFKRLSFADSLAWRWRQYAIPSKPYRHSRHLWTPELRRINSVLRGHNLGFLVHWNPSDVKFVHRVLYIYDFYRRFNPSTDSKTSALPHPLADQLQQPVQS